LTVEDGSSRFQKVPLTRGTVELPPGATTGMPVGAQIAQTEPSPVITTGMRTKVPGGVDLTRTSVRRGHGGRWHRRRRLGCAVSRSHRAQGGFCVRPSKGLDSLERGRLGLTGSGSAGASGAVTTRLV